MKRLAKLLIGGTIVFAAVATGGITTAWARTNHALLVAVSEYPNLDEKFWLTGPRNDAELVRNFLLTNNFTKFEKDNVITLAEGTN